MATLSPASAAAIARLRSYIPPPTTWYSLPLSRRAAVLIVLFADRRGELRVVLTMRAATLRNYAGQAALPGGKADNLIETPAEIARREANEEVGLPLPARDSLFPCSHPTVAKSTASITSETKYSPETPTLPYPFRLEHLCQLPTHLAKTELGVRPCVAWLHTTAPTDREGRRVGVESTLIPRLDAKEVAAVFSAPFHNFLKSKDEIASMSRAGERADGEVEPPIPRGKWYEGSWIDWHEDRWRMHNFYVPVVGRSVTWPTQEKQKEQDQETLTSDANQVSAIAEATQELHSSSAPTSAISAPASPLTTQHTRHQPTTEHNPLASLQRFRVFGMTARILVDCARVAYGEEPDFPHNHHFGDEAVIGQLLEVGRLDGVRAKGDEFVGGDMRGALGLEKGHRL